MKVAPVFQTYTGKLVNIEHPTPEMIDIDDIAHALSMTCRFGGHCRGFYSVAEHSVHAVEVVRSMIAVGPHCTMDRLTKCEVCLGALLHDAAEAYVGDVIFPQKGLVQFFSDLEARWLLVIRQIWPMANFDSSWVQQADHEMLYHEVQALCRPCEVWNSQMPTISERRAANARAIEIECWSPSQARLKFLNCYRSLIKTLSGE